MYSISLRWSGLDQRTRPAVSGTYSYRLTAGTLTLTEKMALLR